MPLNHDEIDKYLKEQRSKLLNNKSRQQKIELTTEWVSQFEHKPAVYVLIDESQGLVYVGETASLRGRMGDLRNTMNHCVRRSIGEKHCSNVKGYEPASSKKAFSPLIEERVNKYIEKSLKLSYLYIELGRKELEELIQKSLNPKTKLNKRGRRVK